MWCGGRSGKKAETRGILSDDSCLPQTWAQAEVGGHLTLPLSTSSQGSKATVLTQGSPSQGRVTSTIFVSLDNSHLRCILEIKMSLFHTHFIWSSHIPITSLPSSAQLQQSCQILLCPAFSPSSVTLYKRLPWYSGERPHSSEHLQGLSRFGPHLPL